MLPVIHTDIYLQANVYQVAVICLMKAELTSLFLLNMYTRKLSEMQTSAIVPILGNAWQRAHGCEEEHPVPL